MNRQLSFVVLALCATFVGACGGQDLSSEQDSASEPTASVSSPLLTCNSAVALSGVAGGGTGTTIVAIQASGGNFLTVTSLTNGVMATQTLTLGTGITVSGGLGSPSAPVNITEVGSLSGDQVLSLRGSTSTDPVVTGFLTFTGVRMRDSLDQLLSSVSSLSASNGVLTFGGSIGGSPKSVALGFYSDCGIVASVVGTSDLITLSATAAGASRVDYLIDDTFVAFSAESPSFTANYESSQLASGHHKLIAIARDADAPDDEAADANLALASSPPTYFDTTPTCYAMNRVYDPSNIRWLRPCFLHGAGAACSSTFGTMQSKCSTLSSTCGFLYCVAH